MGNIVFSSSTSAVLARLASDAKEVVERVSRKGRTTQSRDFLVVALLSIVGIPKALTKIFSPAVWK
jgi:hypothetical protein